jgi:hypothetical protein
MEDTFIYALLTAPVTLCPGIKLQQKTDKKNRQSMLRHITIKKNFIKRKKVRLFIKTRRTIFTSI